MNPPVTTFIFDCFGVVSSSVLNGWYKKNMLEKGKVDEGIQGLFRQGDLGKLTESDILEHFMKYDGVSMTREELRKDIDGYLKLDDELVEMIRKLRRKGFKVALLSNAINEFFERKVYPTYPEFKSLFDEIVISSVVGMAKPDKGIYEYTLKKLGSKAEESAFIDDSKANVQTALDLGMRGLVYTDSASFASFAKGLGIDLS